MTAALKQYLRPDILLCTALLLAGFGISMFFGGYQDIHYAPAVMALVLFACIGIIPALWSGLEVPAAPAALVAFIFWLYVTLSLSWSTVPFASLVTYLIFIACPLVFFTLLLTSQRQTLIRAAGIALWAGLALVALWAVIQYSFFQHLFGPRAHHPLPNPNNLAGLLNLGLLPSLALLFGMTDRRWKFLSALALYSLFFAGLVATESRGGMLAFLIAVPVLLYMLRGRPPAFWQRFVMVLVLSAVIFVLASMAGEMRFADRMAALGHLPTDSTALARLTIWENTLAMVKDYFWLGAGLGTFYLYYPGYRQPGMADNSTGHWAHMDPLQYWAEMGVLAPLLFYALGFAILFRTIRALKALPKEAPERTVIAGSFCALLALVLHTHATFHLYIMPILIVFGTWLAAWYYFTAKALDDNAFRPVTLEKWQRPFMGFVTIITAGLISVMALSAAAGQHHLLRAHKLIQQGLTEQFVAAIEEAEKWAPRSFIDPEVKLAAFYIDLLGKNAAALFTPAEQQALYQQTKQLLDIAGQMNPAWAEIDYKRGQLYAAIDTGFEPEARLMAIKALEQAVQKNPTHVQARHDLAVLYIKRGKVDEAYQLLETGLQYPHSKDVEKTYTGLMQRIKGLVEIKRTYETQKAAAGGNE